MPVLIWIIPVKKFFTLCLQRSVPRFLIIYPKATFIFEVEKMETAQHHVYTPRVHDRIITLIFCAIFKTFWCFHIFVLWDNITIHRGEVFTEVNAIICLSVCCLCFFHSVSLSYFSNTETCMNRWNYSCGWVFPCFLSKSNWQLFLVNISVMFVILPKVHTILLISLI